MNKIKLNYKLFGYRICKLEPERASRFLTKILRCGFTAIAISSCEFAIKEADVKKIHNIINEFGAEISSKKGFTGLLSRAKRRYGIISASIITLVLCFTSQNTVWDIRVSGNETLSSDAVLGELEAAGFKVGSKWNFADKSKIEGTVLDNSNNISWVNINRRGSVAYVDIIEKKTYTEDTGIKYSNIVAAQDTIIEQISVKSGYALVKVGDTVKAGDVLIVGIKGEDGEFCRAEGTVIGRCWQDISIEISRRAEEKILYKEKRCALTVKIFDFSLNIFKNYGNLNIKYDIINKINKCKLGRFTLPITFITQYKQDYEIKQKLLTDTELIYQAKEQMSSKLSELSENNEILKIRTEGHFTDKGYYMISHMVNTADVGKEVPYQAE